MILRLRSLGRTRNTDRVEGDARVLSISMTQRRVLLPPDPDCVAQRPLKNQKKARRPGWRAGFRATLRSCRVQGKVVSTGTSGFSSRSFRQTYSYALSTTNRSFGRSFGKK